MKIRVLPTRLYATQMPSSEVCLHMRIAGKRMLIRLLEPSGSGRKHHAVQLYSENGIQWSAPILPGGAGLYRDQKGFYLRKGDE